MTTDYCHYSYSIFFYDYYYIVIYISYIYIISYSCGPAVRVAENGCVDWWNLCFRSASKFEEPDGFFQPEEAEVDAVAGLENIEKTIGKP